MKVKIVITIISSIIFFISCDKKNKESEDNREKVKGYTITGNIKNVVDSTWVYVNKDNKRIDSTQIINETFEFTGSVEEPTSLFMIMGKTNREYFDLWAENQNIKIKGEQGNLKNALIIGGEAQKESDILKKRNDSLNIAYEKVISQLQSPDAANLTKEDWKNLIKEQNDIFAKINKNELGFVKEFPNSHVSAKLLKIYTTTWDKKTVSELYENFTDEIKKSKKGKEIKHFLSLPDTPKIGEKYIDFELPNTTGNPTKLSAIKGKYVLVEFWASWCAPCIEANPKLVEIYNTYKNQGFEIIGVSLDINKKHWIKAIEKDNLLWVNVSDLTGDKTDVTQIYGVNGIPDNFLIDEEGKIIAKTLRGNQLENKLKELFK